MLKKPPPGRAKEMVSNKIDGAAPARALRRSGNIFVKRIYEDRSLKDGYRILVDRLWPRGVKKEEAHIDLWMKEIAPSQSLRTWFQHDSDKWAIFQKRYLKELEAHRELITVLTDRVQQGPITLLYAAKNESCNHAVALKTYLLNQPDY